MTNLRNTKEVDANLLDATTILVASNLGSCNSHGNIDLRLLLVGGRFNKRFKHDLLVVSALGTVPLSNLYISVLN